MKLHERKDTKTAQPCIYRGNEKKVFWLLNVSDVATNATLERSSISFSEAGGCLVQCACQKRSAVASFGTLSGFLEIWDFCPWEILARLGHSAKLSHPLGDLFFTTKLLLLFLNAINVLGGWWCTASENEKVVCSIAIDTKIKFNYRKEQWLTSKWLKFNLLIHHVIHVVASTRIVH
jgi:hypothetical protein